MWQDLVDQKDEWIGGKLIELGDRIKQAAKQIRRGNLSYYLDDFDTTSLYIMCDFAESILETIAPALEDGCRR